MTRTIADIDLLEDTWARAVPYDQFELLRRDAPVYWHEHPEARGFWAVTVRANWRIIWRFEGEDAVDVDLIDYH